MTDKERKRRNFEREVQRDKQDRQTGKDIEKEKERERGRKGEMGGSLKDTVLGITDPILKRITHLRILFNVCQLLKFAIKHTAICFRHPL